MKAKEYYDLYGEKVFREAIDCKEQKQLAALIAAFVKETKELFIARSARTDLACVNAIRQQNQKWNALVQMYMEKKGQSPIVKDGFWKYMAFQIPDLEKEK